MAIRSNTTQTRCLVIRKSCSDTDMLAISCRSQATTLKVGLFFEASSLIKQTVNIMFEHSQDPYNWASWRKHVLLVLVSFQ